MGALSSNAQVKFTQKGERLFGENAQLRKNVTTINEQLAWLAGIADGEGSFYLTATYDRNHFPVIKCSFAVGNTSIELILGVKQILEQIINHEFRYCSIKGRGNRKSSWLIQVTSFADMAILCKSIMPYLVAKKRQAETMLEFVELGTAQGRNRFSGRDMKLFEKRSLLITKMKHLNRYRMGPVENEALPSQRETERVTPTMDEETIRTAGRPAELPETSSRLIN
jgi:hypothetical protein